MIVTRCRRTGARSAEVAAARRAEQHEHRRDRRPDDRQVPGLAEERRAEAVDDARHRVEREQPLPLRRDQVQRVDDRAHVHEHLDHERHHVAKVAVGDGQRREEVDHAQGRDRRQREHRGQEHDVPGGNDPVVEEDDAVQRHPDDEVDHAAEHRGGRHEQPREVDLGQQVLLIDEALAALIEGLREERPGDQPREDEHRVRVRAVGVDLRQPAEDDGEDDRLEQRDCSTAHATPRTVCL